MMNLTNLTWQTGSDKFSTIFAIMVFSCVFTFPFFVWWLLWSRTSQKLNSQMAMVRYGSTYFELKTDKRLALLYNVFYMLRRLLFASLLIIFDGDDDGYM